MNESKNLGDVFEMNLRITGGENPGNMDVEPTRRKRVRIECNLSLTRKAAAPQPADELDSTLDMTNRVIDECFKHLPPDAKEEFLSTLLGESGEDDEEADESEPGGYFNWPRHPREREEIPRKAIPRYFCKIPQKETIYTR